MQIKNKIQQYLCVYREEFSTKLLFDVCLSLINIIYIEYLLKYILLSSTTSIYLYNVYLMEHNNFDYFSMWFKGIILAIVNFIFFSGVKKYYLLSINV